MAFASFTLAVLRARLQDRWESAGLWVDVEANAAINEALRTWNTLTATWYKTISTTTPAPASPYVAVPGTLTFRSRVQFGAATTAWLRRSSLPDLSQGRPGWRGETTATGGVVPAVPKIWAPFGLTRLVLWPYDAATGSTLTVEGVANTPVLSADGDFVDLSQAQFSALLAEAHHIAAFKLGGARFAATATQHQQFLQAAARQNTILLASAQFRRAAGLDDDASVRA